METYDLAPRGTVFWPDAARAIAERFAFQKYPQALEQFDEQKGVEFHYGKWNGLVVEKLTIFNTLITLETRSNTSDSKKILEDMLLWATAKFKLNYKPGDIKKFGYVSSVTFYSDAPLLEPVAPISTLAAKTSKLVSEFWGENIKYEGLQISVGHDPLLRRYGIANFFITHRAETKFSEHKYFSEAPLPTDDHLRLLEEYEKEVIPKK